MEDKTKLLIAVGPSVTANCQPCLEHLVNKTRASRAEEKEILEARTGKHSAFWVRNSPRILNKLEDTKFGFNSILETCSKHRIWERM